MLGEQVNGTQRRKIYLNIKEGAVVHRSQTGAEERYTFVEGTLEDIYQKERTFRNEKIVYWYLDLRDRESGDLYALGFPYGSNVFKSIILSLSSDEAIDRESVVRIEPYVKNGYDKVVVYSQGVKLDWVTTTLPPVVETVIGGRRIKDDTKRMEFISSLVESVLKRIGK